jgi:Cobalamin biosynthesis protein CobN and related Mg-chelatases
MNRKYMITSALITVLMVAGWILWNRTASTTRIALLNFQQFQTTSIIKANEDRFIRYEEIGAGDLGRLSRYDFVLGFGMGLSISAEERAKITEAAEKGTPIMIYAATNPENNINNLDSLDKANVSAYIGSGNKSNYRSLARYVRQSIDKKHFFVTPPDSVVASASNVLYHIDEEVAFEKVAEYEGYLKKNGFYTEGGAKIAVVGGLNDPYSGNKDNLDSMIVSFQRARMNIYPVASAMRRLQFMQEINPDAVIYFAHGRLAMGQADAAVDWLKEHNIPMFAPLSILQTIKAWEKDKMGMFGGFMSQSIVMPELDGAIYPYVINAQEIDDEGLYLFKSIPDRLNSFIDIVKNIISLKTKNNGDKKLAIYYFKGAGQESLTAQGLETVPSLYNFLKRLRAEGYNVANLPSTEDEFRRLLMTQGAVMSTYAEGAFDDYLSNGKPALIEKSEYESWIGQSIPASLYKEVTDIYGEAPGTYMSVHRDEKSYLAVARIELGNIALLPQPMAGLGDDSFSIVHGAKSAPPHTYIGAYLWSQYKFKADAMIHFGTHGSFEFTPQKQVALSSYDWPDRLVGTVPHFYYYTIGNIGESMMAKRRSYAATVSYLTPPFMESNMRSRFKALQDKIVDYYKAGESGDDKISLGIKKITVDMGIHRELRLDSILTSPYSLADIERIENFAEEIANEKITGELYTIGVPYSIEKINSSVLAMSADPIAYSVASLDRQRREVSDVQLKSRAFFTEKYLEPVKLLVKQVLAGRKVDNTLIYSIARVGEEELVKAKTILNPPLRGIGSEITSEQKEWARCVVEVERTVNNILNYRNALLNSPEAEMASLINALGGGYIAPTSGGDAVANPSAVPTGRNLYAINAEATPSEAAWEKGVALAKATIEQYKKSHGVYPRKVSYTFWSSEFIETEGATIAQVLYMLGVEPVRDAFGRVSDLRLITSEALGRPRVDVVVQTSGQFRDLAATRLALISRAVEMAASAMGEHYDNYVSNSTIEVERQLVEQGVPPKSAREMSLKRVFGGANGMYGTGIQGIVLSGDRWESENEIAETYINNVGAIYGGEEEWGEFHQGLLRAVLHSTDVVVQPRQSNTWGALSLDHVFEFMGGLNLAVRNVTGKDPDAYFADYRNRNNVRMQELKEAIGIESRSTIFNPTYIKEVMKGKASSASQITEVVTNTYGWNVMKPDVIDNEMWNEIYNVYVKDSYNLGIQNFYRRENPAAMQEITAVMMETARKGMWRASEQQLSDIAQLHTDLVREFGHSGSGFSGNNAKLQEFISKNASQSSAVEYNRAIGRMNTSSSAPISNDGTVLKKENLSQPDNREGAALNGLLISSVILVIFIILLIILRRARKRKDA